MTTISESLIAALAPHLISLKLEVWPITVIDHERKFIFIHVPRTGGHSGYKMLGIDGRPNVPIHQPRFKHKENYFSFGFIRNPWDRMYSCYRRQGGFEKHAGKSFKHYIFEGIKGDNMLRPAMWMLEGCDYIGRYESLQMGWDYILQRLRMTAQTVPQLNKYGNSEYRDKYDVEMIDYIAAIHASDVKYGCYSFESKTCGAASQ